MYQRWHLRGKRTVVAFLFLLFMLKFGAAVCCESCLFRSRTNIRINRKVNLQNLTPSSNSQQYTVLEIQFRSVNYTLVARICKNFEQNNSFWQCCSRRKQWITILKSIERFEFEFYCKFYIQHNKTLFFYTIISYIIIYCSKRVSWIKIKLF